MTFMFLTQERTPEDILRILVRQEQTGPVILGGRLDLSMTELHQQSKILKNIYEIIDNFLEQHSNEYIENFGSILSIFPEYCQSIPAAVQSNIERQLRH